MSPLYTIVSLSYLLPAHLVEPRWLRHQTCRLTHHSVWWSILESPIYQHCKFSSSGGQCSWRRRKNYEEHLRRSANHQSSTESATHHSAVALDRLVLLLLLQQLFQLLLHRSNASPLVPLLLQSVWLGIVGQTESP
jgi:hypothetical protein